MDNELLPIVSEYKKNNFIKVIGVGGGGNNAVNYMYNKGIKGVDFVVCNTDIQALRCSPVRNKIQIGKNLTCGLGSGSIPAKGKESAYESIEYIESILRNNTKMVFITAGMGGGTGTGAAPVIAEKSKELGLLTVAIVTIPFYFEGRRRLERALDGIKDLNQHVDAILVINNQTLREMYGDLRVSEAFAKADDVLAIAARSIAEIITKTDDINVDLKDVESVTRNAGVAVMGSGEEEGENRGILALEKALTSPLLNSSNIYGASDILLNIVAGESEPTASEIRSITSKIRELVGTDVNIIWGYGKDETLGSKVRVTIIATGFPRKPLPDFDEMGDDEIVDIPLNIINPGDINPSFVDSVNVANEKIENPKKKKSIQKEKKEDRESDDAWFKRRFNKLFEDRDTNM